MYPAKRLIILLFLTLYTTFTVFSQQEVVDIRGSIIEESNKEAIEQATVRLLNLRDSALVGGVTSLKNGSFSIPEIKPGTYLLHISYIGFEPVFQPLQITGNINPVEVGELLLKESSITLEDAVIIAEAPPLIIRNDTIEYNADSYKVTEGAVLEDLLKRLPGVEVSRDGKITINGKEISKILVDGKEFFSTDPKVASKNLPADMIEKVQTYEKKSDNAELTGFDDGQEENVINLTVKPEKKRGWFGNALAGYGSQDRYEANTMVNRFVGDDQFTVMGNINNTNDRGSYDDSGGGFSRSSGIPATSGSVGTNFNKEINSNLTLNGDLRYNQSDSESRNLSRTENILSADSSLFENRTNENSYLSRNTGTSFTVNWNPDTLTTVYFRPNFSFSRTENRNDGVNDSYDQNGNPVFKSKEEYYTIGDGYSFNSSLHVGRRLNSKGRYLNVHLGGGYNKNTEEGTNYSSTDYYQRETAHEQEIIDQQLTQTSNSKDFNMSVSWTEPLGENYFLQAYYDFQVRNQETLKYSYSPDKVTHEYSVLDSLYSQSFEHKYIDQRLNISFRSQQEKYFYQVGLNIQPSYNSSRSFVGDTTLSYLSRTILNYSPTIFLGYRWTPQTSLHVNYSGNTLQPSMSQLQPVREVTSSTHITEGNPNLKTSYMNHFGITFHRFKPEAQQALMIMGHGSYTVNSITSRTRYESDGSGKRITTYENVNGNFNTSFRISYNSPLRNRKFTYNTSSSISYSNNIGFINEDKSKTKNVRLQEQIRFNFRSDRIDVGIDGNISYTGSRNNLQKQNNRNTWNYNAGGYTTIHLPLDFKLESDFMYQGNAGYSDGFKQKEALWNLSASKSFLKNKQGTLRFKIYDILNKQSNISRHESPSYIQEYESESLNSYFMFHFIYRFQIFPGVKGSN